MSLTVGNTAYITAKFRNARTQIMFDPASVRCRLRLPDATTTLFTYGVDGSLTRSSTGIYVLEYVPAQAGEFTFRFEGDDNAATEDEVFRVAASVFYGG